MRGTTNWLRSELAENQMMGDEITALYLELGWIELVAFQPIPPGESFYGVTEAGREVAPGGMWHELLNAAQRHFPEKVAEVLGYPTFDDEPEGPEHSENTVLASVLAIFPDAEMGSDNDGQLVIYTNCMWSGPSGESILGNFRPARNPILNETPEGYERLMVLEDGETYSGLAGCSIREVPLTFDHDADVHFDSEPDAVVLVTFNDDGGEV